jgi:hypothetical protein
MEITKTGGEHPGAKLRDRNKKRRDRRLLIAFQKGVCYIQSMRQFKVNSNFLKRKRLEVND